MANITQKILIDLETSKAQEEMKKLAKAGGNTADTIKALNARAKELETSLGAIKAAAPTSTLTAFKDGIKAVGNAMQPFNQGLELGKKALGFVKDGLDAYAKSSFTAGLEVKALTNEFEHYRDTVMESVGKLAVELLKPAASFQEQAKELMKLQNMPAFQILYGNKGVLRGGLGGLDASEFTQEQLDIAEKYGVTLNRMGALKNMGVSALKAFEDAGKSLGDTFDEVGNKIAKNATARVQELAAAAHAAAIENARWVAEFHAAQLNEARNYGDARKPTERAGYQIDTSGMDQGALSANALDQYNAQQARLTEQASRGARYAESQGRRNDTQLAKIFGPIEDLNAYTVGFGALNTAVTSAMGAWISGSMSLGQAIKKGIGDALAGLAQQMSVEALKHGAYALGSLAFGDVRGAGQHAAAAAAFGGAAVAAAVAAKKLGGSGETAKGSSSAGASGGSGGGGSGGNGGGGGTHTVVVAYADPFAEQSPRERALTAERTWKRVNGGSGSTDSLTISRRR